MPAFIGKLMLNAIERDKAAAKLPSRTKTMSVEQRRRERAIALRFQVETSRRRNKQDWALEAARKLKEFAIAALPEDERAELARKRSAHERVAQIMSLPVLPRMTWTPKVFK